MVVVVNILSVKVKGQYALFVNGVHSEAEVAYQKYKGGQQKGQPHLVFLFEKMLYTVFCIAQILPDYIAEAFFCRSCCGHFLNSFPKRLLSFHLNRTMLFPISRFLPLSRFLFKENRFQTALEQYLSNGGAIHGSFSGACSFKLLFLAITGIFPVFYRFVFYCFI